MFYSIGFLFAWRIPIIYTLEFSVSYTIKYGKRSVFMRLYRSFIK